MNGIVMTEAAAAATPEEPRAPMTGVVDLLYRILDDLGARAQPTPIPAPDPSAAAGDDARPDPEARGVKASLGDLVDSLDERGFGLLFFLLALPCIPPFVYVLPQIAALPMLLLAGQMAAGRKSPWLPAKIREQRFEIGEFRRVVARMEKYVRFCERFARPRFKPVTSHRAARIAGALIIIPAISILVPLPTTNSVPAAGIAIAALGFISGDGALVVLGLLIGVLWPIFLVVAVALLGAQGLQIIKEWLASRF